MPEVRRHAFHIHAERDATVLPRIALLFRRRGCPLQTLTLEPAAEGGTDRIRLQAECGEGTAARLEASLRNLTQIISVGRTSHGDDLS